MSYSPAILTSADYPDIRAALGLDEDDVTTLPDSVIELRPYLRHAEGEVQATITAWATILAGADDRAAALQLGVVQLTASRLAAFWMAPRAGQEVKSQGLGPASVSFRQGPDWWELATKLAADAAMALHRAEYWSDGLQSMTLVGRAGPTRKARTNDTRLSLRTLVERLTPEAVKGHEFSDHAHEETV